MKRPIQAKRLPIRALHWEQFVDLLGKAHRTLARFELLTKDIPLSTLRSRELKAQLLSERSRYKQLLSLSAQQIRKREISLKLLSEMHKILKPDQKGKFRKKQNWIGPKRCAKEEAYFLPPLHQTVPLSMKNLQLFGQKNEPDPLVQLAIFFAQLLIIHPFMDGNGRLARSMIPLFLYKKKLTKTPRFFMSPYFRRHRLHYFERLYLISDKNDWEGWIRFFLQGIIEEGERINTTRSCRRSRSFSSSFSST